MSSKEIAELTGKRHDHVMRDIREMLEALGEDVPKFGAMSADAYGRPQPAFSLPKDLTITLISGYSVVMRHRIVTRWQELEARVAAPALPNFGNPAEVARASTRIKATAAEQRQLWRDIGEALRFGRSLHKADRAFAQWVNENGFGDMSRHHRADSMWLAEKWAQVCGEHTPAGLSNPSELRRWFNEAQAATPPTPELAIEAPARLTASIEQVAPVAHKVNKLASMAERGEGQEKATALLNRQASH